MLLTEEKRSETLEFLKQLYKSTNEPDRYLLHFTDIEKAGIKPSGSVSVKDLTPVGIYGYSLADFFDYYRGNIENIPYASGRKYIIVLEIKPDAEILVLDKSNKEAPKKYFKKLTEVLPELSEIEQEATKNPVSFYASILSFLFAKQNLKKVSILFTKLMRIAGIDAIHDECTETIHPNERCQTVVINPAKARVVKILLNPEEKNFFWKKHKLAKFQESLFSDLFEHADSFDIKDKKTKKKLKLLALVFSKKIENKTELGKIMKKFVELFIKTRKKVLEDMGGIFFPEYMPEAATRTGLEEFLVSHGLAQSIFFEMKSLKNIGILANPRLKLSKMKIPYEFIEYLYDEIMRKPELVHTEEFFLFADRNRDFFVKNFPEIVKKSKIFNFFSIADLARTRRGKKSYFYFLPDKKLKALGSWLSKSVEKIKDLSSHFFLFTFPLIETTLYKLVKYMNNPDYDRKEAINKFRSVYRYMALTGEDKSEQIIDKLEKGILS